MDFQQTGVWTEDPISTDFDLLEADKSQLLSARLLRYYVAAVYILYSIIAFSIEIRMGFYALKLFLLGSTCLLLICPANYPFLLGLIISLYYELKPYPEASADTSFMVGFLFLITIAMAIVTFVLRAFGDRRNPYKQFDLGTFCLLGIVGFSFLGFIVVQNRFLYAQRVVEIIGYGASYYLGKSFLRNIKDLKLLLTGLCLGIVAFTLPWTVGYIMRYGFYILGRLHEVRLEVGTGVAKESGSLLIIFAFAFSISGNRFPPDVKRFAFWLVAIPAVISIVLLVSRAAVLLIPVAVVLTFIFSSRRRAALWTIIVVGIVGSLLIFYFGDVLIGVQARLLSFSEAAETRMHVYRIGIEKGLSNPLFGIGAQQMRATTFWYHIHNDELTILAEHGVFAFILYVLFWFHITQMALRARVSDDIFLRTLASSLLVVMVCYLGYAQIEPMYFCRGGVLFTFLMGGMTSLYHKYQAEKQYLSYVGT